MRKLPHLGYKLTTDATKKCSGGIIPIRMNSLLLISKLGMIDLDWCAIPIHLGTSEILSEKENKKNMAQKLSPGFAFTLCNVSKYNNTTTSGLFYPKRVYPRQNPIYGGVSDQVPIIAD